MTKNLQETRDALLQTLAVVLRACQDVDTELIALDRAATWHAAPRLLARRNRYYAVLSALSNDEDGDVRDTIQLRRRRGSLSGGGNRYGLILSNPADDPDLWDALLDAYGLDDVDTATQHLVAAGVDISTPLPASAFIPWDQVPVDADDLAETRAEAAALRALPDEKRCARCREHKAAAAFRERTASLDSYCIDCRRLYSRQHYARTHGLRVPTATTPKARPGRPRTSGTRTPPRPRLSTEDSSTARLAREGAPIPRTHAEAAAMWSTEVDPVPTAPPTPRAFSPITSVTETTGGQGVTSRSVYVPGVGHLSPTEAAEYFAVI